MAFSIHISSSIRTEVGVILDFLHQATNTLFELLQVILIAEVVSTLPNSFTIIVIHIIPFFSLPKATVDMLVVIGALLQPTHGDRSLKRISEAAKNWWLPKSGG